jgi:hypothetical protein
MQSTICATTLSQGKRARFRELREAVSGKETDESLKASKILDQRVELDSRKDALELAYQSFVVSST